MADDVRAVGSGSGHRRHRSSSLVIDESKTGGALFFRLFEAPQGLVVHDSVKKAVEQSGAIGVTFLNPERWTG